MPKKQSTSYPRDLDRKLDVLIEGFEKHADELSGSDITKESLDALRESYVNAMYKVTDFRTELKEAIEARDKLAVETYRKWQKAVSFIKYKFGTEDLTLLDFGINPRRVRTKKPKDKKETGSEI